MKKSNYFLTDFTWRYIAKSPPKTFRFPYISVLFVQKELKLLSHQKSTGTDNLPPGLLKDCGSIISKPLCDIINLSIRSGKFPSSWKAAKVTPIFKSGSRSLPEKYSPISVIPIVSKLLEKAAQQALKDYFEQEIFLFKSQHGFRKKHSTKKASIYFCDSIRKQMDNGKLTSAAYVDLLKAFDTIRVLQKLSTYGVKEKELEWFNSYLFNRQNYVCADRNISSPEPIYCGVPQGSILGPSLFIIFINDLSDYIEHASVIMYTDEKVLHVSHESKKKIENNLNQDMQNQLSYFPKNEPFINFKKGKTETMLFGTTKRLKAAGEIGVLYNNQRINFTETYKYLAYIVDHHLNFRENFEKSHKKASRRLRLLERMRCYFTSKAVRLVYFTIIIPLLTSSCTFKSPYNNTQKLKCKPLDRRAGKVIKLDVPSIENLANCKRVLLEKSCFCKESNEEFNNYSKLIEYKYETKNNSKSIKLPPVKLELAKKGFYFTGGVLSFVSRFP